MNEKLIEEMRADAQKWDELTLLFREVKQARDELKQKMLRAVYEESENGVIWLSNTLRVRAKDSSGRHFSTAQLREKYGRIKFEEERDNLVKEYSEDWLVAHEQEIVDRLGNEWVNENSGETHSVTIEVKHMKRGR